MHVLQDLGASDRLYTVCFGTYSWSVSLIEVPTDLMDLGFDSFHSGKPPSIRFNLINTTTHSSSNSFV